MPRYDIYVGIIGNARYEVDAPNIAAALERFNNEDVDDFYVKTEYDESGHILVEPRDASSDEEPIEIA